MAVTILHKRNATPGAIPTIAGLAVGEFAVNTADGEVFFVALKDPAGGTDTANKFIFNTQRPPKADGGEIVAPPPATDPYFANVALLLHMDGANGSTTFTDSSSHARTVAGFGGAAISTGQSKFGGASALLGAEKYLTTDDIVGEFGTQPFTVECWLFLTQAGNYFPTIFSNYQTYGTSVVVLFEGSRGDKWELTYNGNYPGIVSSADIAYNQWVHVAVVRNANTLALYVDGVREGTADVTGVSLDGNANDFFINAAGDAPDVTNATGYFDEFRVTKGVARYNGASFPVPTAPFPNSGPAPTVPGTPTSLAASGGNAQASLAWAAPASNGGATITDYAVQFSSNGGSTWSTFADGTSSATSATVTGLTNGTAYTFRVAAVNSAGTGAYSSTAAGTPVNALAAPTLTRVSCNGDGQVVFSWTSVPTATTYRLQTNGSRNSAAGTYVDVQVNGSTSWSGDVGGQDFGLGWFRVRAETSGQQSSYSGLVQANCGYAS